MDLFQCSQSRLGTFGFFALCALLDLSKNFRRFIGFARVDQV